MAKHVIVVEDTGEGKAAYAAKVGEAGKARDVVMWMLGRLNKDEALDAVLWDEPPPKVVEVIKYVSRPVEAEVKPKAVEVKKKEVKKKEVEKKEEKPKKKPSTITRVVKRATGRK